MEDGPGTLALGHTYYTKRELAIKLRALTVLPPPLAITALSRDVPDRRCHPPSVGRPGHMVSVPKVQPWQGDELWILLHLGARCYRF